MQQRTLVGSIDLQILNLLPSETDPLRFLGHRHEIEAFHVTLTVFREQPDEITLATRHTEVEFVADDILPRLFQFREEVGHRSQPFKTRPFGFLLHVLIGIVPQHPIARRGIRYQPVVDDGQFLVGADEGHHPGVTADRAYPFDQLAFEEPEDYQDGRHLRTQAQQRIAHRHRILCHLDGDISPHHQQHGELDDPFDDVTRRDHPQMDDGRELPLAYQQREVTSPKPDGVPLRRPQAAQIHQEHQGIEQHEIHCHHRPLDKLVGLVIRSSHRVVRSLLYKAVNAET